MSFTAFAEVIHWLCTAVLAVIVALIAQRAETAQLRTLKGVLRQLDLDLDDMEDRIKRLTARKGMAKLREEREAAADSAARLPNEDDLTWKKRVRKLVAEGKLNHGSQ